MSERVDVAGVLAAHDWTWKAATPQRVVLVCKCGDELLPIWSSAVATLDDHRSHLAGAITAHIGEVLGGLREDVAVAIKDGDPSKCGHDDGDGDLAVPFCPACDADNALAVVREALGCPPDALTAPLRADATTEAEL